MPVSVPSRFIGPLSRHGLAALLLVLSSSMAWSQAPGTVQRAGTFKQVQGDVRMGRDGAMVQAQPGDALQPAERVRTGSDGGASVMLRDGTVLSIGPNSTAELSQFQFDATTQEGDLLVDLLQGSMRVVTGILSKINPERFKVKTPTAVVGVRGTDFIVEAIPEENPPLRYYIRRHWSDFSWLRR